MRLSREVSKIPLCVIDTAVRLRVRQKKMLYTTTSFAYDHPNRYLVISFVITIVYLWQVFQKYIINGNIAINFPLYWLTILSTSSCTSNFSVRNRKLSTFSNDVCIDVIYFSYFLSFQSSQCRFFWKLTYLF